MSKAEKTFHFSASACFETNLPKVDHKDYVYDVCDGLLACRKKPDGALEYNYLMTRWGFNQKMDSFDNYMQETLNCAVAESKQEVLRDVKGIVASELEALTPSLIQAVQGELAATLQHLKSAISSRFDEDVQELKVWKASDGEEQPHPPLRQSLERLDQRHSTVLQSLQENVDRANAELVESMCLSALESNHMMDLERAVQFARDVNMVHGPQYMAATTWLKDLSVNAFTTWTLATSNFKALYDPTISKLRRDLDKPGALPSSGPALLAVVKNFLLVRSSTAGKAWRNADVETCLQALAASCNKAIAALGGPSAVTVQDWASFIWTTPDRELEACGAPREFCFLMSEAHRDDDKEALRELLPFTLVMNSTLVTRGDPTRHDLWPVDNQGSPVRQSYRGTGVPTSRLAWFKVIGRTFRVPFNLASALAIDTAKSFAERSVSDDASKTGVIFHIKFTDSLEAPAACMHVSLMRRSVIPTELEFLFAAYSIFTIVDYEERRGGLLKGDWLYVDLEAAEDNKGNEHMPLAQWM